MIIPTPHSIQQDPRWSSKN